MSEVTIVAAIDPSGARKAEPKCERGHSLVLDPRTTNYCDICRQTGTKYRCSMGCDFDMCERCFVQRRQAPAAPASRGGGMARTSSGSISVGAQQKRDALQAVGAVMACDERALCVADGKHKLPVQLFHELLAQTPGASSAFAHVQARPRPHLDPGPAPSLPLPPRFLAVCKVLLEWARSSLWSAHAGCSPRF